MPEPYHIRDLVDPFEIAKLEDVQADAWGYDDREVTPGSMLTVSAHFGGVVAGAYAQGNDQPVGFVYGIPAQRNGQWVHHSHMLAIVPAHRGTGLASALKLHQRERALALGYTLMTWTMDPLLARNARLNMGKLGARAVAYCPDWYATVNVGMYAGLSADRFLIEWDMTRPSQAHAVQEASGVFVLVAHHNNPNLGPQDPVLGCEDPVVLIEVPREIDAIKRDHMPAAQAWRHAHRQVFAHYFERGYAASDLVAKDQRVFYRLELAK